jgi:putative ABC transport system ATP-binding protein
MLRCKTNQIHRADSNMINECPEIASPLPSMKEDSRKLRLRELSVRRANLQLNQISTGQRHPAIAAKELWKIYCLGKVEYPALRGLTMEVEQGEFIAVVGPSGSGKSTLLNLFGALDRPTRGQVLIDGVDISKLNDDKLAELRNRTIGFVFQTFNLLPYMNSLENIEVPLIAGGVAGPVRRKKSQKLLEMVGLKGFERNRPSELSGGQQQRVAIARALTTDPKIIMADEPTGNLDSKSAREIIEVLHQLNERENVTVVMVTHNLQLTDYCRRIIYVKDGLIEKEVKQDD